MFGSPEAIVVAGEEGSEKVMVPVPPLLRMCLAPFGYVSGKVVMVSMALTAEGDTNTSPCYLTALDLKGFGLLDRLKPYCQ